MFKDIFELEDEKLKEFTNAKNEKEIQAIEIKYAELLKELEIKLDSDIISAIEKEQEEVKKKYEEEQKVEQAKIDEQEEELKKEASIVPEEEVVLGDMESDFLTLSVSTLVSKYAKDDTKKFGESLGVDVTGKEEDIVERIILELKK